VARCPGEYRSPVSRVAELRDEVGRGRFVERGHDHVDVLRRPGATEEDGHVAADDDVPDVVPFEYRDDVENELVECVEGLLEVDLVVPELHRIRVGPVLVSTCGWPHLPRSPTEY
jgi:hypothetical protein